MDDQITRQTFDMKHKFKILLPNFLERENTKC